MSIPACHAGDSGSIPSNGVKDGSNILSTSRALLLALLDSLSLSNIWGSTVGGQGDWVHTMHCSSGSAHMGIAVHMQTNSFAQDIFATRLGYIVDVPVHTAS